MSIESCSVSPSAPLHFFALTSIHTELSGRAVEAGIAVGVKGLFWGSVAKFFSWCVQRKRHVLVETNNGELLWVWRMRRLL